MRPILKCWPRRLLSTMFPRVPPPQFAPTKMRFRDTGLSRQFKSPAGWKGSLRPGGAFRHFVALVLLATTCRPAIGQNDPEVGQFQIRLREPAAASAIEHCVPRLVAPEKFAAWRAQLGRSLPERAYDPAEETFEVYVPESYRPRRGFGLLVWIDSDDRGTLPSEDWKPVLDRQRLLFIAANRSGDHHDTALRRVPLALDAAAAMHRRYALSPARSYVAGFGGGGRAASYAALAFPEVFQGAVLMCGAEGVAGFGGDVPLSAEGLPEQSREKSRYAILTGEHDPHRETVVSARESMIKAGIRQVHLLDVPGLDHRLPPAPWLARAVEVLDRPLTSEVLRLAGLAAFWEKQGKLGHAMTAWQSLLDVAAPGELALRAESRLVDLNSQLTQKVQKVEREIEQNDKGRALDALAELGRVFDTVAIRHVRRLRGRLDAMAQSLGAQQRR